MQKQNPHDYESAKKAVVSAGKFFLFLLVSFSVLFVLSILIPVADFERLLAALVQNALSFFRIEAFAGFEEDAFVQVVSGPKIVFNFLCTGSTETIILLSAIFATFEIEWKKRLVGAAAGIVAVFAFNLVRIFVTVWSILTQPLGVVGLWHEVLFRIFLFVVIAGLYWAWLRWSRKK